MRSLARDMIEAHGVEASGVARANARTAALAGAVTSARHWIRVLEIVQQRSAEQASGKHTSDRYIAREES